MNRNMKKIIAGVLACCVMGGTMPTVTNMQNNSAVVASAYESVNYDGIQYYKYDDHVEIFCITTKKYTGPSDFVIPAEIDGLPVTIIFSYAFANRSFFESITIPDSVTSIGDKTFSGCTSLKNITIPESVTSIGGNAFSGTPWLEAKQKENPLVIVNNNLVDGSTCSGDVVVPDGVTNICGGAFSGASDVTSITIPESVAEIGNSVFGGCTKLKNINVSENNEQYFDVDGVLFEYLSTSKTDGVLVDYTSIIIKYPENRTETEYILPDNVTYIKSGAFSGCTSLESIIIPESVTGISDDAFKGCTSLKSITIPEKVTNICRDTFSGCTSLESVTIPESVTLIDREAFSGCTSLESITIPEGVTRIDEETFLGCTSLKNLTIPEKVRSIGYNVFSGCTGLTDLTIENPNCDIYVSYYGNSADVSANFNATIHGYDGSTAQAFAEKYNLEFVSLGESPVPLTTTITYITKPSTTKPRNTTTTTVTTITTTSGNIEATLIGDANEDNIVDIADATAIIQHIGNKDRYALSAQGELNADCYNTGDGVTGLDAVAIQNLEAGLIDSLN